jgi:hypothetical protein
MNWTEKIGLKLGMVGNSRMVISDHTKVLLSNSFQDWLRKKKIAFAVVFTQKTLIEASHQSDLTIIITDLTDIPFYICNTFNCQSFDFQDLPFYISEPVARKLSTINLIKAIDYLTQEPISVFNENNYEYNLQKAHQYHLGKVIQEKETIIYALVEASIDYIQLLKIGQLWGELIYLYFEQGKIPNKSLQDSIDKVSEEFILNQGLKGIRLWTKKGQNVKIL